MSSIIGAQLNFIKAGTGEYIADAMIAFNTVYPTVEDVSMSGIEALRKYSQCQLGLDVNVICWIVKGENDIQLLHMGEADSIGLIWEDRETSYLKGISNIGIWWMQGQEEYAEHFQDDDGCFLLLSDKDGVRLSRD